MKWHPNFAIFPVFLFAPSTTREPVLTGYEGVDRSLSAMSEEQLLEDRREAEKLSSNLSLTLSLTRRPKDKNQENSIIMFIHFCCLYPLGLDIKLNFNISKGAD